MELVKLTPEEQAEIEADRALPHCVIVLLTPLTRETVFQQAGSKTIEKGMVELKRRADAAKMVILSTSISTNLLDLNGQPFLSVMILCQWVEIDKLEAMNRRNALAGGRPGA